MESIKGKNALITGAGKGLGKAIALALAAEGVNLALLARTESDLLQVAKEVATANKSVKVATATADVADYNAVTQAIDGLRKQLGSIDILINNAGTGKFGKFMELDVKDWEDIIRINLLGAYYVIRAVLPEMVERQSGDIVNISSTAGQRGAPLTSAYSASKFGLMGLSESLMQEVRKSNIRVFTLTPSTIATDLSISLNLTDGNPDRVIQPEDFAELVVMQLKLNRRAFVKEAGLWSTNP